MDAAVSNSTDYRLGLLNPQLIEQVKKDYTELYKIEKDIFDLHQKEA
jgi:hypothetical protein